MVWGDSKVQKPFTDINIPLLAISVVCMVGVFLYLLNGWFRAKGNMLYGRYIKRPWDDLWPDLSRTFDYLFEAWLNPLLLPFVLFVVFPKWYVVLQAANGDTNQFLVSLLWEFIVNPLYWGFALVFALWFIGKVIHNRREQKANKRLVDRVIDVEANVEETLSRMNRTLVRTNDALARIEKRLDVMDGSKRR